MTKNDSSEPNLAALRVALSEPLDPLCGRGSKTRILDQFEKEILGLIDAGGTYGQVALRLSKQGFIVSEHTIAAWRKRRRRSLEQAKNSKAAEGASGGGAGATVESDSSPSHQDGKTVSPRAMKGETRYLARPAPKKGNPFRRSQDK